MSERKMKLMITGEDDFDRIYDQLEMNFIPEERRERAEAKGLVRSGAYTVFRVCDGDTEVGFVTVWELDGFAFIEHFVTYDRFRNLGYGRDALELLKKRYERIVLEAEPPTGEIPKRRLGFYERCGFCRNTRFYLQPPFRGREKGVELVLMSYPTLLPNFDRITAEIYRRVYGKEWFSGQ